MDAGWLTVSESLRGIRTHQLQTKIWNKVCKGGVGAVGLGTDAILQDAEASNNL